MEIRFKYQTMDDIVGLICGVNLLKSILYQVIECNISITPTGLLATKNFVILTIEILYGEKVS